MSSRRFVVSIPALAVSGAFAVLALSAHARSGGPDPSHRYPDRPIRLIVPFPPGGATEILARTLGPKLTEAWGQPAVIDNRPGAAGTIGATLAAKARPDGHTLMLGSIGNVVMSTRVYPNLPYDSRRDFSAISNLVNQPIMLVSHPSSGVRTIEDLVKRARASPEPLIYGSTGTGGAMHLAAELLQNQAGIKLLHVPYKGGGPLVTATLGTEVPLAFVGLAPALPHIRADRLVAVATAGSARASVLPQVATIGETVAGYQVNYWTGLLAPAATPPQILVKLNAAVVKALRTADVKDRLEAAGFELVASTSREFGATIARELDTWGSVIRVAGIKPE